MLYTEVQNNSVREWHWDILENHTTKIPDFQTCYLDSEKKLWLFFFFLNSILLLMCEVCKWFFCAQLYANKAGFKSLRLSEKIRPLRLSNNFVKSCLDVALIDVCFLEFLFCCCFFLDLVFIIFVGINLPQICYSLRATWKQYMLLN